MRPKRQTRIGRRRRRMRTVPSNTSEGMTRLKRKDSFHPYAMTTILFWSLAYVLTRRVLRDYSALSLGFLRYFFASLSMLVWVLSTGMKRPRRADMKWFLLAGAVGFFFYMIAFNKGCETVTAATGSVIIAVVPVLTALMARLVFGERLLMRQWAAIAIEFSGVLILTMMDGAFSVNRGLLWLILAALALSVYNLLQRRLTRTYGGLEVSAFSIFAGTAMLAAFLPKSVGEMRAAPPVDLLYIAILGIFSSAVAYAAWAQAFRKADKASSVSNYMFVTPFLTSLMGYVFLGERLDAPTILGGAVILTGVLLFNFGGRRAARDVRQTEIGGGEGTR